MARADVYIKDVLSKFEGAGITTAYVPCGRGEKGEKGKPLDNSGVTIATGLDLGQHSRESLTEMGIPLTIIGPLIPYLGLKKEAAQDKLKAIPLILSHDAVQAIDKAVIAHYIAEVESRFNREVKEINQVRQGETLPFFAERPAGVQAVAVSLRYQLGFKGFPKTWGYLLEAYYGAACAELRSAAAWNGKYSKRRCAEAEIIEAELGDF